MGSKEFSKKIVLQIVTIFSHSLMSTLQWFMLSHDVLRESEKDNTIYQPNCSGKKPNLKSYLPFTHQTEQTSIEGVKSMKNLKMISFVFFMTLIFTTEGGKNNLFIFFNVSMFILLKKFTSLCWYQGTELIFSSALYINIRCGRVVRDFEREAKTRCNFQFR